MILLYLLFLIFFCLSYSLSVVYMSFFVNTIACVTVIIPHTSEAKYKLVTQATELKALNVSGLWTSSYCMYDKV